MSKPSFESMEGREQAEDAEVYSKDYWDLVIEQLGKRKLFKMGMAVLALMYGMAIYAPFITNDRPYRFEGIDLQEYNSAARSLSPVVSSMSRILKASDEEFEAQLKKAGTLGDPDAAPQSRGEALATEMEALDLRLTRLRSYIPADAKEVREGLTSMRNLLDEGSLAFTTGDSETALAKVTEGKKVARVFRKSLRAADPAKPEAGGLDLVATSESPLWDDLSPLEIFFMVFWAFVLTWPIWNRVLNALLKGDRDSIRTWRARKFVLMLTFSILAAVVWGLTWGPGGDMNQNAKYKRGLTEGTLLPIQEGASLLSQGSEFDVPWAMVRFGTSETHSEEQFRPPTWKPYAKTDAEGRWVQSTKVVDGDMASQDGFSAVYEEVVVRAGEPEMNSGVRHLAGVDELGRDFFSRMIWGGRTSLTVGILSAFLLTIIGVFFGSLAGYFGGWVDTVIMRLIEVLQSIPAFYMILMTIAFIPADVIKPIFAIVIVIALIRWTGTARLVRGEFMRLREQEFVVAAKALGFSNMRTIFRHVLPNAMSPVIVSAAFAVAAGILTESAISFLGFGIKPPEASWGSLVSESKSPEHWWIQLFPGILIFITVTCYNLVGDAVRDAMDPKMKK
ncbi:MAG: ABC-type dipeptide/oligopeptide/nickel transport system permease subunit [Planctomycetota bacterium]|jgi:ABC-type dipeptide/oligopeptide/nickel transport system permease subunit